MNQKAKLILHIHLKEIDMLQASFDVQKIIQISKESAIIVLTCKKTGNLGKT